jgi:transposase
MTQGIRDFEPLRRNWRERVVELRTGDGREIPRALKAEIERVPAGGLQANANVCSW